MTRHVVWDDVNESREFATMIEAEYPDEAAEKYAEQDADGNGDDCYMRNGLPMGNVARDGHVLVVEWDEAGRTFSQRYRVGVVDFVPAYRAYLVEENE
jgi:hypothetical protein